MNGITRAAAVVALASLFAAGCADQPTAPSAGLSPPVAQLATVVSDGSCLANPDFVVGDEAALREALDAASEGASIALDGMIVLAEPLQVFVPGLTLGCATPNSGLTLAADPQPEMLVWVSAPRVTLRGLVLDGASTTLSTLYANAGSALPDGATGLTVGWNEITCSPSICVFLVGVPEATVTHNVMQAYGSVGGIHVQAQDVEYPEGNRITIRSDDLRVEGNSILQNGVSPPSGYLSAIRIHTARGAVVTDNVIRGAWVRGIGPTAVWDSRFTGNDVEGVQEHGIRSSGRTLPDNTVLRFADNTVRDNRFVGVGGDGVFLEHACGNVVTGVEYGGPGNAVHMISSTGANTVQSRSVVDQGYQDCDGDRFADFNVVNGRTTLETERPGIKPHDAQRCLAAPDFVVHDEAELRAALEAAAPWDEIALDGMIAIEAEVDVAKPALTFGCASPGSGLVQAPVPTGDPGALFWIQSPDVVIRGLRLDGSAVTQMTVAVSDEGNLPWANERFTFVGNDMIAGPGGLMAGYARDVLITDNRITADGATYGLHIQYQFQGARVERNVLVEGAPGPAANAIAAAIRLRDGSSGWVVDNVIQGPWARGINIAELSNAEVVGNRVEGVLTEGIRTGVNWFTPISVHHTKIQNNRISGAGQSAMFLQQSCQNVLLANHMSGNGDDLGVIFDVTTGANVLTGNTVPYIDDGDFDCTGDGVADPNIITGKGHKRTGIPPGSTIGEVMQGGKHKVM